MDSDIILSFLEWLTFMFPLAVKSIVFIFPTLLPFHSKRRKGRKKQETTRKPAFYTCEWLTYNVNTKPHCLTSHFSLFSLFLSKRENHCINMCDSQAMFSVTCNFNTFFELFVISTIFRKSVDSLFKHIHLALFI